MVSEKDAPAWRLTDHACGICFGRILARPDDGETRYRCSNCGHEKRSTRPESICACGAKLKTGARMGLVCRRNASPTPEMPSEIIVESER